ncbi:electron transfer flavoprotein subunit beta/FixA family protein [Anaeromicrobium sediminis]|uniref:Electron transfer flavoprotein small subunit n=1 Tax=Anaeromicrobium sediminis TaxID=1478221 RepID=A0A267MKM6_9FIRM|nr:electron transfer flavoprotein subunit beta/FixA family protein [Anaeromicrobium sediminis]PAB60086.1 electron transfer flavoprotein subunit beta [Anaeromicrobium sediminis]
MKIAVCVKQVPAYSDGTMDPKTGVMLRSGLESILNVYDLPAIETALRIKEEVGGTVDIFTMGPPKASAVIKEAYAMGADEGYLLSDRSFSGADVLATSYTLMQGIKSTKDYDLILCGKQTTDGDTAQVSGAIAKWLNVPHVNWVNKIIDVQKDSITVSQRMEEEIVIVKVPYPCLLSVERSIFIPRMPSLKLKIAARKKEMKVLSLTHMEDENENNYGLAGSATKVEKIFPPTRTKQQEIIEKDSKEAARSILEVINKINK